MPTVELYSGDHRVMGVKFLEEGRGLVRVGVDMLRSIVYGVLLFKAVVVGI